MHEFELGVWKDHLKQILRVLYAYGGDRIPILNRRYAGRFPFDALVMV